MQVSCSNCKKQYNVPEEKIPPAGVKVNCKACSHVFMVRRPSPEDDDLLQEAPATSAPRAVAAQPPAVLRAPTPPVVRTSGPVTRPTAPAAVAAIAAPAVPAGVGMPCFVHTQAQAVAICSKCGNPVCAQCQNKMLGKNFCDTCAKLEMSAQQAPAAPAQPQQIIVQQITNVGPATAAAGKLWSPGVAAVLSFFIPGLGQMYKGQILNGIAWFFMTCFGYLMVIPGLMLHLFCIIGAYSGDPTKR